MLASSSRLGIKMWCCTDNSSRVRSAKGHLKLGNLPQTKDGISKASHITVSNGFEHSVALLIKKGFAVCWWHPSWCATIGQPWEMSESNTWFLQFWLVWVSWTQNSWWNSQIPAANRANSDKMTMHSHPTSSGDELADASKLVCGNSHIAIIEDFPHCEVGTDGFRDIFSWNGLDVETSNMFDQGVTERELCLIFAAVGRNTEFRVKRIRWRRQSTLSLWRDQLRLQSTDMAVMICALILRNFVHRIYVFSSGFWGITQCFTCRWLTPTCFLTGVGAGKRSLVALWRPDAMRLPYCMRLRVGAGLQ